MFNFILILFSFLDFLFHFELNWIYFFCLFFKFVSKSAALMSHTTAACWICRDWSTFDKLFIICVVWWSCRTSRSWFRFQWRHGSLRPKLHFVYSIYILLDKTVFNFIFVTFVALINFLAHKLIKLLAKIFVSVSHESFMCLLSWYGDKLVFDVQVCGWNRSNRSYHLFPLWN